MRPANRNRFALCAIFTVLLCSVTASAQSTSQEFPTPVTSNEISGVIKPRDLGDARLTSYFYQFDGSQGDLFINIVTRNFTGDIDVFIENGLRPLTKIVVYADLAETETGRVIYLRKPEKMILRVQGRTPSDEVATFRIKFAGSFVASSRSEPAAEPTLPNVTAKNESGIRVNSVGTIVEVIPKATPTPAAPDVVTADTEEKDSPVETAKKEPDEVEVKEQTPADTPAEVPERKVEVVVTDDLPASTEPAPATGARRRRGRTRPGATPPAGRTSGVDGPATVIPRRTRRGRTPPRASEPKAPDPLEKVNLVIQFKDGTMIQRPLSEVLRFTVDKGVLTVIAKDGSIGRYSMLDVAKVTIE